MMIKIIAFIFLFLTTIISVSGQTAQIQNLESKLDALITIANKEDFKDADSLLVEFITLNNDALREDDKSILLKTNYWIGRLHYIQLNHDISYDYFNISLEYSKEIQDTNFIIKNYYGLGVCLNKKNNFLESTHFFLKGLNYLNTVKDTVLIISFYQAIAYQFQQLGNAENNIKYLNKSLQVSEEFRDTNSIIYFNVSLYEEKKNAKRFEHIIKIKPLVETYNKVNSNIVFFEAYAKYLLELNQYNEALIYVKKALILAEENKIERMVFFCHVTLGDIYKLQNKLNKSEKYYLKAMEFSEDYNNLFNQITLSKKLSELYQKKENYELAFKYADKYIDKSDSVSSINKLKEVANITVKYESEKKSNEITLQKLKVKEKENEVLLHQKSKVNLLIFSITLFILLIAILLFFKYRQSLKNKEIEKLNIKNEITKLNALIEGEETERKRLAQDLHDGISGDLSAIKYKVDAFTKYDLDEDKQNKIQDSLQLIDQTIDQIRSISHDLAPPILRDMKLKEAISQYCLRSNTPTLNVSYQYFGEEGILNSNQETAIYRIIQELLNNTKKHAQATYCLVEIHVYDDLIHITVEDDGIGMDMNTAHSGLGLSNIKSRILYLNAEIDFDTSPEGTTVAIDIELK